MTNDFIKAVDERCAGKTVAVGPSACCATCLDSYGIEDTGNIDAMQEQMLDEGSFSISQCDSCGSYLAGDRFDAHGIPQNILANDKPIADMEIIHMTICVDCLQLHANGEVPETWE